MPAGPLTYVIIDLGSLGGGSSVAKAINNHGQVVGSADTRQGYRHAYVWEAGTMRDLGTLPGYSISEANDINDVADIVGFSTNSGLPGSQTSSFLWREGAMIDLGHLGDTVRETFANAINDACTIVGSSRVSLTTQHAFLWSNGALTDLGTLGGNHSTAWDLNELGEVVGGSNVPEDVPGGAFVWSSGVMTNLGTLGGEVSGASGVNNESQVVGVAQRAGGSSLHAFLWQNGTMIDLDALLGYNESTPEAINNRSQVIGEPSFLYDPSRGVHGLADLLPPDYGWFRYALNPEAINDHGQIVGAASFPAGRHAFLMTPIDTDFDDDANSDWDDAALLVSCMSGPGALASNACASYDVDRDGCVDLKDARALQWAFTGP
jgi:probable HAF family extracellular repeat protein